MTNVYPERIVSLQPSATATLGAIGALSRVIACTRYCAEACPEVELRSIPLVHDSWTAQADQIVAARPDLVIASVPYQLDAVAQILKSNVRFLGLAPTCLEHIYSDIAIISGAVGELERGQHLLQSMQSEIAEVVTVCASRRKQRVFCEEWGKPILYSQRWVAELIEAAGGVFVGVPGQKTTPEAVLDAALTSSLRPGAAQEIEFRWIRSSLNAGGSTRRRLSITAYSAFPTTS